MQARELKVKEVVSDLRSGKSDESLMQKYGLSYAELRNLLKELYETRSLVESKESQPPPVYEPPDINQPAPSATTGIREERRELHRYRVYSDVPVSDADKSEIHGSIRDITEKGVGLVGIEAEVDETKRLVVMGDTIGEVPPFEFQAKCRWAGKDVTTNRKAAGFQITDISEEDLQQLRELIELETV